MSELNNHNLTNESLDICSVFSSSVAANSSTVMLMLTFGEQADQESKTLENRHQSQNVKSFVFFKKERIDQYQTNRYDVN